jgi:hypothetical protein
MTIWFPSLNALHASTRRNPRSSSAACCSHSRHMAWIPPSMQASRPAQSWSMPHTSFASPPMTKRTHLAARRIQLSLIPMGRMLGHLSRATSLPALRARYAAQGGESFASQSVSSQMAFRSAWFAPPKCSNQCWMDSVSDPPGPALPDSLLVTYSTTSLVISRLTKSGVIS